MKTKIHPQTEQNQERLKEYHRRMALWVVANGITHRAVELRYFGTSSLKYPQNRTYQRLRKYFKKSWFRI